MERPMSAGARNFGDRAAVQYRAVSNGKPLTPPAPLALNRGPNYGSLTHREDGLQGVFRVSLRTGNVDLVGFGAGISGTGSSLWLGRTGSRVL